jgi:hypothetical protein
MECFNDPDGPAGIWMSVNNTVQDVEECYAGAMALIEGCFFNKTAGGEMRYSGGVLVNGTAWYLVGWAP